MTQGKYVELSVAQRTDVLPQRTDLSGYTQSELDKIALRLNQRPRKTLGFETPASKLRASVAPTG
jgi:IS30 family transposase